MKRDINLEIQRQWSWISDKLSMKQFDQCMGLSYVDKAKMAKRVSKSKRIHQMADRLVEFAERELAKPSLEVLDGALSDNGMPSRKSRAELKLVS